MTADPQPADLTEREKADRSERNAKSAADRQLRAEQRASTERRLGNDARTAGQDAAAREHDAAARLHDDAAAFQAEHRRHSEDDAARHDAAALIEEGAPPQE